MPTRILIPCLMLFAILGAFGYLLKRNGYSPAAVVMGFILAPIADNEMIRMFQLYGSDWYLPFIQRPIAAVILSLLVLVLLHGIWRRHASKKLPTLE